MQNSRKMKYLLIIFISVIFTTIAKTTDPIKRKSYFVEFDISYPFYSYYHQAFFDKKGHGLGGGISFGHGSIPVYGEYFFQSPLLFKYRNNEISEQYQEIGLRYNLNHLTYIFPYGLDPYVGLGLIYKKSRFKQYEISAEGQNEVLASNELRTTNFKLSGGIKFGNNNIVLGLHYDYLPSKYLIPNPEGSSLTFYNSLHLFSIRAGIRLFSNNGRRIKCPRFNKRVKGTLAF